MREHGRLKFLQYTERLQYAERLEYAERLQYAESSFPEWIAGYVKSSLP